ncbi:hypothetical protein KY285_036981 [Solanum tuberosum]|nr:hypothetical protein KY285_036981 [Solanum tuberosum]
MVIIQRHGFPRLNTTLNYMKLQKSISYVSPHCISMGKLWNGIDGFSRTSNWQIGNTLQRSFEDVSSGYGDFDVLESSIAYVSPQWSDVTNSPLSQSSDEQYEGNKKTHVPKVFDDLSERSKDTNFVDISCKLSQHEVENTHKVCKLTIRDTTNIFFPNDLAYFVSPTAEATDCENDVKSENKNDEEEIVTIRDGKIYPQHGLELTQCWKNMSSIPSTCSYLAMIHTVMIDTHTNPPVGEPLLQPNYTT